MSLESVLKEFKEKNYSLEVVESNLDTSTVKLASIAFNIQEDEIAKTMGYKLKSGECILILSKGTAKLDNKKYKSFFGEKAAMIPFDEVEEVTGHKVGGVCPFGLKKPLKIYLDKTLKEFEIVYPAGGSANSVVKITTEYLAEITCGEWVDLCKDNI